jgi:ABC-type multidrug transport system fused ATPase/permease subunit
MCKRKPKVPPPEAPPRISMLAVTKHASPNTKLLYFIGVVMTVIGGVASPMVSVVMGEAIKVYNPEGTQESITTAMHNLLIMIAVSAFVIWVGSYFSYAFMQHASEKLAFELRQKYLLSLLQ